jgi:hypothetical protein
VPGPDAELAVTIGAADFFGRGKGGGGIEISDFGGNLAIERRGIEMTDAVHAAVAGEQAFPKGFDIRAERRGKAQAGDDDSVIDPIGCHEKRAAWASGRCSQNVAAITSAGLRCI